MKSIVGMDPICLQRGHNARQFVASHGDQGDIVLVLEPIVVLALTSGARRGEILALAWGAVDLQRGSMTIERSLEQTRAGLSFKAPKTRSGRRHVSLPVIAIEALKAHRIRQLEMRVRLGLGKPDDDTLGLHHARRRHDAA